MFLVVTVGVGIYCRKKATNVDGFVLGGRAVGPWLSAFSFGTSYFSAVIFVGYAGQFGWNFGLASTWIGLGNALIGSYLAWKVLGRRTRVMTQHLGSSTMPDFFEKRYGSKALKLVAAAIVFIFMVPYTASLYNGLSRLFTMAFGIEYWVCVAIMAVVTALYVVLSGYVGTALNSLIQGVVMLVGIVVVVLSVLNVNGGFMQSVELMSQEVNAEAGVGVGGYTSIFGPDPISLLGVVLLTSLGTWGLPQMIGKFYAIKSEKSIKTGTVVSTIFAVIVAGGCYFLGGFGRLFFEEQSKPEHLDALHSGLVPRGDGDGPRIGHLDLRDRGDSGGRAVIIDVDLLQNVGVGSACTDGGKVLGIRGDALLHFLFIGLGIKFHFSFSLYVVKILINRGLRPYRASHP